MTPRVVFDCMVFVQALARPNGPAGACVEAAEAGKCALFVSDAVLDEVRDVTGRPHLRRKFLPVNDEEVADFFALLARITSRVDPVTEVFTLTRDANDSKYLNLAVAVAAGAAVVVSRDNDLLDLMTGTDPDAETFRTTYPGITILDPVAFLRTIRPAPEPPPRTPEG